MRHASKYSHCYPPPPPLTHFPQILNKHMYGNFVNDDL